MKKNFSLFLIILCFLGMVSCTRKSDEISKSGKRVLNLAIINKVKGMDPIYASDVYSGGEIARVYEGLYEYHYLKRPYQLVPNLAASMPKVSKDGLTYTFPIKKGVFFHHDKAFTGGKGRELVAQDFVYSIKRLADPKLQSSGWWLLEGKVAGLDIWRKKYADLPKADYTEEVEGLKALDKYTLQIKLKKNFPQFLYGLAMPFTYVVAKEVVELYGKEFLNHPVGTGPFILPEFKQSNRIHYRKNLHYRKKLYPSKASGKYNSPEYLEDAGKPLPLVDEIIVNVMMEDNPRMLNFRKGKVDYIGIPKDHYKSSLTPSQNLVDGMKKQGIRLITGTSLDITYVAFNHEHELFKNKKLREALQLAYDVHEVNKLFFNGFAEPAQSIVPPGISGHIVDFKNENVLPKYDINNREQIISDFRKKAKEKLKEAGYPDGKGLPPLTYDTTSNSLSIQRATHFKEMMKAIGVQIQVRNHTWPKLLELIRKRSIMLYSISWSADYPDAENFLQLIYGPNRSPGPNGSGFNNPEFNRMYEKSAIMQDSPERTGIYEKMVRMAAEEVPWILGVHRKYYVLSHGWIKNYVITDFSWGRASYLNVDLKEKKENLQKL